MIPAPGSDNARKLGCVCPHISPDEAIRENLRKAHPDDEWVAKGCPVHDPENTGEDGTA